MNPKPCFAESRGEKLTYLNFTINNPILIVNPGIHISTKWAYEHIAPKKPEFVLNEIKQEHLDDFKLLKEKVKNNFEGVVFSKYKLVEEIKNKLYENGALFALMSGSGSTVFGIFKDSFSANEARKIFEGKYLSFIQNQS